MHMKTTRRLVLLGFLASLAAACGGGGAPPAGQNPDSPGPIEALETYLATPRDGRPELATQPFAMLALSKEEAEAARVLLWDDFAKGV